MFLFFFHRQVDAKWFMVTAQPLTVGSLLVRLMSDLNTVRKKCQCFTSSTKGLSLGDYQIPPKQI